MALYQSGTGLTALVGIGITNPTSNLHVVGNVLSTNFIGTHYGSVAGSNTISASTFYGVIAGSNTIAASTITATTVIGTHYGVIAGSNTISCSSLSSSGSVSSSSDIRIKTDLETISNAIDKIKKISGYTFNRTDVTLPRQVGVVAQEILEVLPEAVHTDEKGTLSVAYGNLTALLIEALKEEIKKREELEKKVLSRWYDPYLKCLSNWCKWTYK